MAAFGDDRELIGLAEASLDGCAKAAGERAGLAACIEIEGIRAIHPNAGEIVAVLAGVGA